MHGPAVLAFERKRAARGRLRLGVLVHLLEPERVHAEDVGKPRNRFVPVRQHARHAIAQVERIAAIEVHQVARLQRERVARMLAEHVVEREATGVPVAVEKSLRRVHEPAFAIVGARLQRARGVERPRDFGQQRLLGHREHRQCAEQVADDELRRIGQCRVERRDRVADVGLELPERDLVLVAGERAAA